MQSIQTIPPIQVITCINNKGGVGKTTLTYTIGCQLASRGNNVLLIDADPQCNLTLLSMGAYSYKDLGIMSGTTIYDVVKPNIQALGDIDIVQPITLRDNLAIVPGHIDFSLFDDLLGTAYSEINGSGATRGFRAVSALRRYIDAVSMRDGYNIVLIDVAPTMTGSINKTVLLSSDFFVTICNPDIFSTQGIHNLGQKVAKRKQEQQTMRLVAKRAGSDVPAEMMLDGETTFLGYILNEYNVYADMPITDHRHWIDTVGDDIKHHLSMTLSRNGLVELSHTAPLGMTQDYGRIPALGQKNNIPLYEVSAHDLAGVEGSLKLLEKCREQSTTLVDEMSARLVQWAR